MASRKKSSLLLLQGAFLSIFPRLKAFSNYFFIHSKIIVVVTFFIELSQIKFTSITAGRQRGVGVVCWGEFCAISKNGELFKIFFTLSAYFISMKFTKTYKMCEIINNKSLFELFL
jgi:hypothetical protein